MFPVYIFLTLYDVSSTVRAVFHRGVKSPLSDRAEFKGILTVHGINNLTSTALNASNPIRPVVNAVPPSVVTLAY